MNNDFAAYLKQTREKAHLTQQEVSEALGYTTAQFISNWERGVSCPPIKILKALAKLYKVSPKELFQGILELNIRQTEENLRKEYKKLKR